MPLASADVLCWDETRCHMMCPAFDEVRSAISHSSFAWSVLLSRREIIAGFADGRIESMSIVVPPQILLECNASTLFDALYLAQSIRVIMEIIEAIMAASEDNFKIRGSDRATSNLKMVAHEFHKTEKDETENDGSGDVLTSAGPKRMKSMMAHFLCGNHGTNLVEMSATALFGTSKVSMLWSTKSFFQLGAFYLRMIMSVKRWLSIPGNLVIRYGAPPSAAIEFAEVMVNYILEQYGQFANACSMDQKKSAGKPTTRSRVRGHGSRANGMDVIGNGVSRSTTNRGAAHGRFQQSLKRCPKPFAKHHSGRGQWHQKVGNGVSLVHASTGTASSPFRTASHFRFWSSPFQQCHRTAAMQRTPRLTVERLISKRRAHNGMRWLASGWRGFSSCSDRTC